MGATTFDPIQDLDWATSANRWSLKMCGIWRDENQSRGYNAFANLLVPLYVSIIAIFGLFPQTWALLKVWGDLTLVAENLTSSMPLFVTICEITTMWINKEVIITMMDFIREDWIKLKNEENREVMIKHAKLSRKITVGGYWVIATSCLMYHLPIIFGVALRTLSNITDGSSDRHLALQSIYFFDVYQTPLYEIAAFGQALSSSVGGFCYMTFGALFGVVVLHVSSQLENLKMSLECMAESVGGSTSNFQNDLSANVQEHQRLIRFVDMIENTFSLMLLLIVPAFMITCCVQGFRMISNLDETSLIEIIFGLAYMFWLALVMFIYSSTGQVLVTQSEEIQYAAYNCEWYDLKPKEAAQLIVILIRSQRPLTVTAGKVVPLDLSTFASLLKTTGSYLSCLLAVRDK